MKSPQSMRWIGQAAAYGAFALFIGYFSNSPAYQHLPPDQAVLKLSLRHSGQVLGECKQLSPEELAQLPPTRRAPVSCPRERSPLELELVVNGKMRFSERIEPRGLHHDGMASTYHRINVPAGSVSLTVRMKDRLDQKEFPYVAERQFDLRPGQVLLIDFDSQEKRFSFL
ncbi:MAG TPA: hypothetical protein PKZ77_03345 [Pseudomonadales bacterium]|nr:hypothetical protein [Pseudomonadales bacterium]HNC69498.1 hypothetical protein [Pseudomonadales bacterium]